MTTGIACRILGTGSRLLEDRALVRHALTEQERIAREKGAWRQQILVVHGAQGYIDRRTGVTRGADLLVGQEARALGMQVHPVPARWRDPCFSTCKPGHRRIGRDGHDYCPAAGNYRNQCMVDLGPYDICVAFPIGRSTGTRDCMRRAEAAGIGAVTCETAVVT